MNRLSTRPHYEAQQARLSKLIEVEAKKLQEIEEQKETLSASVRNLSEREASLIKSNADLEQQILEKQKALDQLVERQSNFLASFTKELKNEKTRLLKTTQLSKIALSKLDGLNKASIEIEQFMKKNASARIEYRELKTKVNSSEKKIQKISKTLEQREQTVDEKLKNLDVLKTYLTDLYGRIAMYVRTATETIEYINAETERRGVPIQFGLPPGQLIGINFEDFDMEIK